MFCPHCSTENPNGSTFCNACGNRLLDTSIPPGQTASTLRLQQWGASLQLIGYILLLIPLLACIFACVWFIWTTF